MDAVRELLDLLVRWIHVIAGIMWIGNSLLFNWLDRNLRPAAQPRDGSRGEIWLLHSGGFYDVEKTLDPGGELPRPLHWFKWQAYTTWLSGAALLVLVYHMSGAVLLVEPGSGLSPAVARAIAVVAIAGGLILYEALWRSPLAQRDALAGSISFALVLAAGYGLGLVLTDRAAFLHLGALLGTLMAANVMFHIMPSQRAMVAAVQRGEPPDNRLSDRAKVRSIHNNYMTFPVVILMLISHFPRFYGPQWNWLVLAVLLLAGAGVRHILNIRFGWKGWVPALAGTTVAAVAALYVLVVSPPFQPRPAEAHQTVTGMVTFAQAETVIRQRCTVCHSAAPADRTFGARPGGVAFDTPDQMRGFAPRIRARAVETRTMPPGNATWMTEEERAVLSLWVRQAVR